jgi:poly(A) polymerase
MGLPYLLGDKDPQDPIAGWDKTWKYLKELRLDRGPLDHDEAVAELQNWWNARS